MRIICKRGLKTIKRALKALKGLMMDINTMLIKSLLGGGMGALSSLVILFESIVSRLKYCKALLGKK